MVSTSDSVRKTCVLGKLKGMSQRVLSRHVPGKGFLNNISTLKQ